ncbi:MAG: DUF99 family protein [Gammaproteobacteria bacterium]|nr:DUF99 family protein [Gammaproteobacteria bacterium]NIR97113.1 DUF99 family protein [Gammaproteobacteria bacterium]NIT62816.1 DUF99 family protein [Gammaproteobacteria bacterium]NIV19781.1 DUF99 family protein [Gammaproteobacteria bacterium]NIX11225.1 DUF99 family protein [Gammaproteobacteria bacterium]
MSRLSHVIGFDDAPFSPEHRGDVLVVGALFSGLRLDGVLSGKVRRDGANATGTLIRLVGESRFRDQVQAVLTQGIAFAGFNVIDIRALHEALGIAVVAISRRRPDLDRVRRALMGGVPGGPRKWAIIERTGPMERIGRLYVQRAGIGPADAKRLIERLAVNGVLPEPVRTAHLIAGGIARGESRHRP